MAPPPSTYPNDYKRNNIQGLVELTLAKNLYGTTVAESFAAWNDFTIRQDDEEASILPSQIGRTAIK